jgi:glutamyl-Q tRNA(Asp) synthetase
LRPILRFAPSPNGRLHLGHAYAALCNERAANALCGALKLRIEDIDPMRSKREYEEAIVADLAWLGVAFDAPHRRQSDHLCDYAAALAALRARRLIYPCYCSRGLILAQNSGARDPDGSPLHARRCVDAGTRARLASGEAAGWRLDMREALAEIEAPLFWDEYGEGDSSRIIEAAPLDWGDVLLAGRERPATYHLAVVVDDASQEVTDIVRGRDLFLATSIHVVLQALLGLPRPRYRHHRLVLDQTHAKMSKSLASKPLAALREEGFSEHDIRASLGFGGLGESALSVVLS